MFSNPFFRILYCVKADHGTMVFRQSKTMPPINIRSELLFQNMLLVWR